MSVEAQRWVTRHAGVTGTAREVLRQLAWHADHQGRGARRSHAQLAEEIGRDRRTVQRALGRLEAEGHVRRHLADCGCKECRAAARGVVVFDVVLGRQDDVASGQLVMLTSGRAPQVARPDRRQSAAGRDDDQRQSAAPTSGTVPLDPAAECRPLNDPTTNCQPHEGGRTVDPEHVPADFPVELRPHLDLVVPLLQEVAEAKRAAAVHRGAVARTIAARPRRPLVRAAHDFAAYFLAGRGANRKQRDIVSAYRNWLDREGDLAGPEPLPGSPAPAPSRTGWFTPATVAAGEFAKYDRAMGLA